MGRAKEEMMRQQELEPFYEWLEDNYGDDAPEEDTDEWDIAFQEFCDYHDKRAVQEMEDYYHTEYEYYLNSKLPHGTFLKELRNIGKLLEFETDNDAYFSLLVMLHAHAVASFEAYLASTFIQKVTGSDALIRRLVESDPVFSQRKLTFQQLFEEHETIKHTVAIHLKAVIFHKIDKVKPMFKAVLDIDFGDVDWLVRAVRLRHDCVHRAGLNKDGEKIDLSQNSIEVLVSHFIDLALEIEEGLNNVDGDLF